MNKKTRARLEAAKREILSDWEPGPEIVGVEIVEDPRPGLILQLQTWPVGPGQILDVFIAAHAEGESDDATGILDEFDDGPGHANPLEIILFHLIERLGTGDFQRRSSDASNGHLSVNLYG